MVTGDNDDRGAGIVNEPRQGITQQADGLRRRHGTIVHVAGDEHRVGALLAYQAYELTQHDLLMAVRCVP